MEDCLVAYTGQHSMIRHVASEPAQWEFENCQFISHGGNSSFRQAGQIPLAIALRNCTLAANGIYFQGEELGKVDISAERCILCSPYTWIVGAPGNQPSLAWRGRENLVPSMGVAHFGPERIKQDAWKAQWKDKDQNTVVGDAIFAWQRDRQSPGVITPAIDAINALANNPSRPAAQWDVLLRDAEQWQLTKESSRRSVEGSSIGADVSRIGTRAK
jgi:hypothetical protein